MQEKNPAAAVEDRGSAVRLTAMKTHRVATRIYVELESNHKVTGWGEISALEPRHCRKPWPTRCSSCSTARTRRASNTFGRRSTAPIATSAAGRSWSTPSPASTWPCGTSTGKLCGVPVYRLLGGPCRDRIRVYHTAQGLQGRRPAASIHSRPTRPTSIAWSSMVRQARRARRPRRRRHVRRPLRHSAADADPVRRGRRALRPALPRGAGRAGQHRGLQTPQGSRSALPWPPANATAPSGKCCPICRSAASTSCSPTAGHTGGITQMKKIASAGRGVPCAAGAALHHVAPGQRRPACTWRRPSRCS